MYEQLLNIESNPVNISLLEGLSSEIVRKYEISNEKYPNILICLTEAMSNAIVHGNKSDKAKKVSILAKRESDSIVLRVKDEGDGFDYSNLPDPTIPENIEAPGGRGIFVIKSLSNKCVFHNNGNTIDIHIKY